MLPSPPHGWQINQTVSSQRSHLYKLSCFAVRLKQLLQQNKKQCRVVRMRLIVLLFALKESFVFSFWLLTFKHLSRHIRHQAAAELSRTQKLANDGRALILSARTLCVSVTSQTRITDPLHCPPANVFCHERNPAVLQASFLSKNKTFNHKGFS